MSTTTQWKKRAETAGSAVTDNVRQVSGEVQRRATDPTALYAAVGLTDAAVAQARSVTESLTAQLRQARDRDASTVAREAVGHVGSRITSAPSQLMNDVAARVRSAQEDYGQFAARGQNLVSRVSSQEATKDLRGQVDQAVNQSKSALGTIVSGWSQTRSAGKAAFTTGRRETAERAATTIAGESVSQPSQQADEGTKVGSTSAATKRATTTARTRANKAAGATTAAAESAGAAATQAATAGKDATSKVGSTSQKAPASKQRTASKSSTASKSASAGKSTAAKSTAAKSSTGTKSAAGTKSTAAKSTAGAKSATGTKAASNAKSTAANSTTAKSTTAHSATAKSTTDKDGDSEK